MHDTKLCAARRQSSHTALIFFSLDESECEAIKAWSDTAVSSELRSSEFVLRQRVFRKIDFRLYEFCRDIDFDYVNICDLALDGASEFQKLGEKIQLYANKCSVISKLQTWLYYPVSEKVGDLSNSNPPFVTLALANAVKGQGARFREWYSSQHIRHALNIPALLNGQRFERCEFQSRNDQRPEYESVAIYSQSCGPEQMLREAQSVDPSKLPWDVSGDLERFSEWTFEAVDE